MANRDWIPGSVDFRPLNQLRVVTDERLIERVWVFPYHRWVEYGPEDEGWARAAGYSHEEVVPSRAVHRLGDTLYMHPQVLAELQRHLDREERQQQKLFEIPAQHESFLLNTVY